MDQNENPTPPVESASGAPGEGSKPGVGEKGDGGKPSVDDLLAAARGDVVRPEPKPAKENLARERTAVPPSASRASSGTVADAPPTGDAPGKEVLVNKCFQCHSPNMWMDQRQDRRAWESALYRMVGRGALWTQDEIKQMADFREWR